MKQRIITGFIAAVILVGLVFYASFHVILAVSMAAAAVAYLEFDKMFFVHRTMSRQVRVLLLIVLTVFAMRTNTAFGWLAIWVSFLVLAGTHVVAASRSGAHMTEVRDLAFEILGYLYIVSLLGFITPIAELRYGRSYLLLLFTMVFVGDTTAYFAGTFLGKHTLAERVSPRKSVEGAIAAAIGTTLCALAWAYFFYPGERTSQLVFRAALGAPFISVLAQMGDLLESLFKRSRAQKDSGDLFPGHGGILDRIDSLALATPVYYAYLVFFLERA